MLALAPSPVRPDALLTPVAPSAAYAADVARLNGREPIGPADDAWLALAHALARAAQLPASQRAPLLAGGADGVEALLPGNASVDATLVSAVGGLRVLAERLGHCVGAARRGPAAGPDAEAVHGAVGALQAAVAEEEQAGAFVLAFGTLAALRVALAPVLDRRAEGLLLAQQGRVARQLGAMTTAAELYAESVRAARAARAPDVAARALIGGGVLAGMRGNYPEARALFRRGIAAAERGSAKEHQRAGHHGLFVAALAARDVNTALTHGWAAFQETPPSAAAEKAEMLLNLGDLSRHTGEYRASLGACLMALELTDNPRLRLPALATAALAGAQLGEVKLLAFLARDIERMVGRSGQPFENARALVEMAEAYVIVRDPKAVEFAQRAESLALGRFHELTARAESVRASLNRADHRHSRACATSVAWSQKARHILAALERMQVSAPCVELSVC